MARIKRATRKKSTKRLPLAVVPHKNVKSLEEKETNVNKIHVLKKKALKTEVASPGSSSNTSLPVWSYFSSRGTNNTSFTVGKTNKMKGLPENAGKWLLFSSTNHCAVGGESHHQYTWKVAKDLVKDFENTGVIAAKCSPIDDNPELDAQGTVCCYTSNFKDKLSVKRAADAIFKIYPYPLSMYYKTEKNIVCDENKMVAIYRYTIENKLYERTGADNSKWQLVEFQDNSKNADKEGVPLVVWHREVMPCTIVSHQWLYVSSFPQNGERFVAHSLNYVEDLPDTAGKWLLFNDSSDVCPLGGVTHHDFAWKSLKHLVIDYKNSNIVAIKCSTNSIHANHPAKGVTCCYTADSSDKSSIITAAEAIRKAFHYYDIMYYKVEGDSSNGHVDTHISIYKHTSDNKFYERTEDRAGWKLVNRIEGPKMFKCNFCDYSNAAKWKITRHTRTHTGEKPFQCEICKKCFSENSDLKKHMQKHKKKSS